MKIRLCVVIVSVVAVVTSINHAYAREKAWQVQIESVLSKLSEATTKADSDQLEDIYVLAHVPEARLQFDQLERLLKDFDRIDYKGLSFLKVRNICYVTVKQTLFLKNVSSDSGKNTIENTRTFVFVLQKNRQWKILDSFKTEDVFVLTGLSEKCEGLARTCRKRPMPWTMENLEATWEKYRKLDQQVRDATICSPESAMFGGSMEKWTELQARQIRLTSLAEVSLGGLREGTGQVKRQDLIRIASQSLTSGFEALAMMAQPVLRVTEIREEGSHVTIGIVLHPVVFSADPCEVSKAGFSAGDIGRASLDSQLCYVKASDFALMDCAGNRIIAIDLGTTDVYANRQAKYVTKAKDGSMNVQELIAYGQPPVDVVVRFAKDRRTREPYKMIVRDCKVFGVPLIRPKLDW